MRKCVSSMLKLQLLVATMPWRLVLAVAFAPGASFKRGCFTSTKRSACHSRGTTGRRRTPGCRSRVACSFPDRRHYAACTTSDNTLDYCWRACALTPLARLVAERREPPLAATRWRCAERRTAPTASTDAPSPAAVGGRPPRWGLAIAASPAAAAGAGASPVHCRQTHPPSHQRLLSSIQLIQYCLLC